MELVTPLPASIVLPPEEDDYVDPPSILLPLSRSPSPSPPASPSPKSRSLHSLSGSFIEPRSRLQSSLEPDPRPEPPREEHNRVQDLESRLAAARQDMEDRENALQEVREELERLHLRGPIDAEDAGDLPVLS